MINLLRTGTRAVATAVVLAACGSPIYQANSPAASDASHPAAAQCTSVKAAVRQAALLIGLFAGVTTAHDVAVAERKLGKSLLDITGNKSVAYLVPIRKSQPLSRELRLFLANEEAYWAASAAYSQSKARPQAVGRAA